MLRKILAIAGRPGLFSLVSQGKNMLIVEDIVSHKRTPAFARDKVSALADISIYTVGDDTPLPTVLANLGRVHDLKPIDLKALDNDGLASTMSEALPEYDTERVRLSDIRKLIQWYNILLQAGITSFEIEEQNPDSEEAPAE